MNDIDKRIVEDDQHSVLVRNRHLAELPCDNLYHLSLDTKTHDLKAMFNDVQFVCTGGTARRMERFARLLHVEGVVSDEVTSLGGSSRYAMYKAGPVLCVSHGMGVPSLSIMMHELLKLMHHAQCPPPTFLRIGTCGGIGIPPGSLVISETVVDGAMRPYLQLLVLGKEVRRPAILDHDLASRLKEMADEDGPVFLGKTMCTDDFYEGQARLDGAFCDYSEDEKLAYLKDCRNNGVTNIEMESLAFAAICHHAHIKGGVVCVSLVDRLAGDQIRSSKDELEKWQERPLRLALRYIEKQLKRA